MKMEPLITPARVAELAFRAPDFINPPDVAEATILAAQHKFVRPVLGALYGRLCAGGCPDFVEEYLAPPLALWVKALMLPTLAVQAGAGGVAEVSSRNLARAGDAKLRAAVRRLRGDASALMDRAVEYVEANPSLFPEYNPRDNVRRRCSTDGGVVIPISRRSRTAHSSHG